MRIAMWSGPRNLSTAMMYAFGARSDCAVVDEPFYAAYLAKTGLSHPMRSEIMAAQSNNPDRVINQLTGPIPDGKTLYFQKHMTQHMVPAIERTWMTGVTNIFLIRHPARVIASYARKREAPTIDDIGFRQQAELFEYVKALGINPVVIDSSDIRSNPRHALLTLCQIVGIDFQQSMLNWPVGPHVNDGVWASHWYGAVHQSTGFLGKEGDLPVLTGEYQNLAVQALTDYEYLLEQVSPDFRL